MSLQPRIDSPCPLRFSSLPTAGMDFCTRCARRVHNLDQLSEGARLQFLKSCEGPVCVAYTVRRSVGAAAATALVAAAGLLSACSTTAPPPNLAQEQATESPDNWVLMGAVTRPGEATFVDVDSSLEVLPQIEESALLEEGADTVEFVQAPAGAR